MKDKIFSPIKERLLQFIDNKGIKKDFFFKKIGLSASNFKGSGAKSELGGEKIVKILSEYTELNADWLLTGRGEMLKSNNYELTDIGNMLINKNEASINTSKEERYINALEKNLEDLRKAIEAKDAEIKRLIEVLETQKTEHFRS